MPITKEQFHERRKALGLTQEAIAEHLQVSRTTVARWETGARALDPLLDLALEALEARLAKTSAKRKK